MRLLIVVCLLLVNVPSGILAAEPSRKTLDLVIRGGTLIDGSAAAARRADVGILDGRIVEIGDLKDTKSDHVIDAVDLVVSPGFIDLHSHADRGLLEHGAAENYVRQGVTTLLCGNCGYSPTDIGTFYQDLRKRGIAVNVAMLIGHGSVREKVMGQINAPPDNAQLAAMRQLVKQAMQDGAVGLSTSLRYGPGTYATTDEIVELTTEIAPFGGFYATHMRDEGTRIMEAIEEALLIGSKANVPVHISHHKISSASVFGLTRQTLARIDAVRATGRDVTLDQYPYAAGSGSLTLYVPQWSLSGGNEAYRKRLEDPETKARILESVHELLRRKVYEADQNPDDPADTAVALARIQIARAAHDTTLEGKTVSDILIDRQLPVTLQNGCKLLVELVAKGTGGINHTLDDRPGGDVDRVMTHPQTCIASDGSVFQFGTGSPHPRSYGCFPRVLGRYVRERKLLTLEQAVHKMTALPAARLGWKNRGRITVGSWADIAVFDPRTIADEATFAKPHQHSTGVQHVLVRGTLVLNSGKMTGERPGQPLSREVNEQSASTSE